MFKKSILALAVHLILMFWDIWNVAIPLSKPVSGTVCHISRERLYSINTDKKPNKLAPEVDPAILSHLVEAICNQF